MSDYRYKYTNKHGTMMDGMNKGSTCKRTCSQIDKKIMKAKRCARVKMSMQRCVHRWMDRQTCEDVFAYGWTDEHTLFVNRRTCQACRHTSKEQHVNATSGEPNDHQRPYAPFHAEVKL